MLKVTYQALNYNAVIMGSNSGMGKALTELLIQSGAIVFGVDIQEESASPAHENFQYFNCNPLDFSETESVAEKIQAKTGYINGLVNLSGTIAHYDSFEAMPFEAWEETYDISFKSCYNSCKVFVPLLRNAPHASIVNMSSGLAFGGQKNYGPYTTAKAAVVALSRTLATELAPSIRVNSIAPGAVDTNFIYKADGTTRFDKKTYEKIAPLGCLAKPEEIASAILFLLSENASHITGQCLHVNGGAMMV